MRALSFLAATLAASLAAPFAAGTAMAQGVVTIYSSDGLHDGTPS